MSDVRRPKHPVINAVGYLTLNEKPWLLMIQVSLSPYKEHRPKAKILLVDMKKRVTVRSRIGWNTIVVV